MPSEIRPSALVFRAAVYNVVAFRNRLPKHRPEHPLLNVLNAWKHDLSKQPLCRRVLSKGRDLRRLASGDRSSEQGTDQQQLHIQDRSYFGYSTALKQLLR